MDELVQQLRETIRRSPISWAQACGIHLRPYQAEVARAIKRSIVEHSGRTYVVIMPRQSGKNEIQAHLMSWTLFRFAEAGGRIVSVSPTFKPQTQINMERVKDSLNGCIGSRGIWKASKGYLYQLGNAKLQFFSGEARANVLGATADLLLSVDEAQSISVTKFDKDFDPMTASTNATRVFWGTAWTTNTLLERERRVAMQAQEKDGEQRLFYFTAEDVRALVPAYGAHVDRMIAEHGRNHPGVRSQYFGETIDAQAGMFNAGRIALIFTNLTPGPSPFGRGEKDVSTPVAGRAYAFLIDVAGMDEARVNPLQFFEQGLGNPGRDSTALSIVEIDLSSLGSLGRPSYSVVARRSWTGENHLAVFAKLKALAETWQPQQIVVDATGVGEGLWALLERAFPRRVIPVKFSQPEKSEIGWRFLSIIETGQFHARNCHEEVRQQYSHCISEILPGPLKTLRWGVPDGTRGPDGELIHDDFVLANSLVAKLDELGWHVGFPSVIIPSRDPMNDRDFYGQGHFGQGRFGPGLSDHPLLSPFSL